MELNSPSDPRPAAPPRVRHPWLALTDLLGLVIVVVIGGCAPPVRYLPFDVPLGLLALSYAVSFVGLAYGGARMARVAAWASGLRMLLGLGFIVLLALTAGDVAGRFGPIGPVGAGALFGAAVLFVPYLIVFPALQIAHLGARHGDGATTFGARLRRLLFASLSVIVVSFVAARAYAIGQAVEPPSDALMRQAFAALRGEAEVPEHHAAGPIVLELIQRGRLRGQFVGSSSLSATLEGALAHFGSPLPNEGSWVLSVPTRCSHPAPWPLIELLQLAPAHDGVALRQGDALVVETPLALQLRASHAHALFTPFPLFEFGTDLEGIVTRLREQLPSPEGEVVVETLRFRTFSDPPYWDSTRRRPLPEASEEVIRQAAVDNVDFLLRHQRADGAFAYQINAATGTRMSARYDFTRHAGATYFLAQAGHELGLTRASEGAARATEFMGRQMRACGSPAARCFVHEEQVEFGASALLAVALYDLRLEADTPELAALHDGLLRFLLGQQRADGEMMHAFDLVADEPVDFQTVFFSGEAALALVRGAAIERDPALQRAARRLLEYLAVDSRNVVAAPYLMSEEHWTCIAYGEYRALLGDELPAVRAFCDAFAAFSRRIQYREGETLWDVTGAYGLGPIVPAQMTGTGTRTEAFAAMALGVPAGRDPALDRQLDLGIRALLQHQFRPGPVHLMRSPERMRGGFTGAPGDLLVRNDYVQHAGSAYIRYLAARF